MPYKLEQQILNVTHSKRPRGSYEKLSITIHSTGNIDSTAEGERKWLDSLTNSRSASWHYVVGEGIVIQAIPENEEAWHCGAVVGNKTSIGVEIVESGNRELVLETAAEFVADLLKKHGFSVKDIKKHYDWTGKDCPRILINKSYVKGGMNWDWLIKAVEKKMEKRYNTIDELPEWAKATIERLVREGKIADGNKLDMSEDMLRVLVIMGRRNNDSF